MRPPRKFLDLLENFLRNTDQELVWVIWGEREFKSEDLSESKEFGKKYQHRKVFQNVLTYSETKPR